MPCDILDIRCIFMNELIGSTVLTMIFVAMLYFIIASKLKFGLDTTIGLAIPFILIGGMMFTGFSAIYAFSTVIVGIGLGWAFQKIVKN